VRLPPQEPGRAGESHLSGAARRTLEDLEREFREEILETARGGRGGLSAQEELTTLEIVRAADQLRNRASGRERRKERLSLAYAGVGASVAVASILVFLLLAVGNTRSLGQVIVAVVGIAAAVVGILGGYVVMLRATQIELSLKGIDVRGNDERSQSSPERMMGLFMNQWFELEQILRAAVAQSVGESQGEAPISKQFSILRQNNVLAPDDVDILRNALDLRNQIAHGGRPESAEVSAAIRAVAEINEKLRDDFADFRLDHRH
jgi:hypothetical protein